MWLAWLATAWAVECKEAVPLDELQRALDAAEQAFIAFDDVGFRDKVNVSTGVLLPCIGDAVPAELAAQYHTVIALHLFTIEDVANARLSLMAARAVFPEGTLDPELFPESHPGHTWWAEWSPDGKTQKIPEPRVGSVAFDGQHTRERSTELPHVFQLFDEQGRARATQYLAPRQELPSYAAIPRQRRALVGCSAGSVVASAALLAGSWASRSNLLSSAQDLSVSADTLDAQRAQMNTLAVGSAALFGVGAGCGVGAALVGER
jgi:hypothetical protein